jgi:hypothetical protein
MQSDSRSRRKRGGQPNNSNAVTHGLYSGQRQRAMCKANSDVPIDLSDEIALMRMNIRRVMELSAESQDLEQSLQVLRVLSFASHALTRMIYVQALILPPEDDTAEALSEALAKTLETYRSDDPLKSPSTSLPK